jgi:hypothetical protein
MNDQQQQMRQANEELEQMTYAALRRAWKLGLPREDLEVLCFHAGVPYKNIAVPHGPPRVVA